MGPLQSNTDSSDLRETARKWILQSLHDKKMAEMNYQHEGYDVAAFLSHQAVEKLFKGLFVIEGKKIPRTHHIDQLAKELSVPEEILPDIYRLAPDYQISRYPDISDCIPYEIYSMDIVSVKLQALDRIFTVLNPQYKEFIP